MLKSVALAVQDILTKAVHVILIYASFWDEFFIGKENGQII